MSSAAMRATTIKAVTAGGSAMPPEERCDSPQHDYENDDHTDDPVARDPLFIAHRAQALNAAGSQVIDQPGVVGGRSVEMIFQAAPRAGPSQFADAQIVQRRGRGLRFRLRLDPVMVHGF